MRLPLLGIVLTALVACTAQSTLPAPTAPPLPTAFDAGWKGERVCEPLFENERMRAARCTFPPGGGHERHSHPAHWGYIVQGTTMRITTATGTVDRVLKSGTNGGATASPGMRPSISAQPPASISSWSQSRRNRGAGFNLPSLTSVPDNARYSWPLPSPHLRACLARQFRHP
jgi:hypothetical protein